MFSIRQVWAAIAHLHTHASTTGQTANDHHNQSHAIDGADHTGALTGELGGTLASPTVDATHSGSAHTDFIAKALVDVKGDIIVATAADTVARLASSGVNDDVLTVDTSTASGLKWAAGGTGSGSTAADLQADGADPLFIEKSPDANVTVPTDYGFIVVGPYNLSGTVVLTLDGTSRMVVL